jgi:type II secretory pathway pseudopilin PulG
MNHPASREPRKPDWQAQSRFWLPGLIILGLVFLALSLFVPFSMREAGLRVVAVPLRSVLTSNYDMDPFSFRVPAVALDIIANAIGDLLTPRDITERIETLANELQTPVPTITPNLPPTSTQSGVALTAAPSATHTPLPPTATLASSTATRTGTPGATPTRTATWFGPTRTPTPFIWYTPTQTDAPPRPSQPPATRTPLPPTRTSIPPIGTTPPYPVAPTATRPAYP